eukprot:SAG11_NODE_698_length_7682_cov_6.090993_4_plen_182_part_00
MCLLGLMMLSDMFSCCNSDGGGGATPSDPSERRMGAVSAHLAAASGGAAPTTGGGASYASWTAEPTTIRVPFDSLRAEFTRVLAEVGGVPAERAELIGRLVAENQRDGVYSHGLNRFPQMLRQITDAAHPGQIDVHAEPQCVKAMGAMEQWDGKTGLGVYNAHKAMDRAIEIAQTNGERLR